MIREGKLRWISSAGGPLVLLQRSSLSAWRGVLGGDYERAGAVPGYAGIMKKEDRDVLVLWGEPLETAYFEDPSGAFLIRWSYGPGDDAVHEALTTMRNGPLEKVEDAVMNILDDSQTLMDAGACGDSVGEHLTLALTPGRYMIPTLLFRPSAMIELIVHPLSRA